MSRTFPCFLAMVMACLAHPASADPVSIPAEEAGTELEEAVSTHSDIEENKDTAPAPAKVLSAEDSLRRDSKDLARARRSFAIGAALAYGSLAAAAFTTYRLADEMDAGYNPVYTLLLIPITFWLGLPIMGNATGEMDRLARKTPGYQDPGSGMNYFKAGLVPQGVAYAWIGLLLASNFEVAVLPIFPIPFPYFDVDAEDFNIPLILLGAGLACDAVALYKFHARRNHALKAIQVYLVPTVSLEKGAVPRPGAMLSLRF